MTKEYRALMEKLTIDDRFLIMDIYFRHGQEINN